MLVSFCTILGPYFGNIYCIYALTSFKIFKFSPKDHGGEYDFTIQYGIYMEYLWAIIGPCWGHFYHNFVSACFKFPLKIYVETTLLYILMFNYWGYLWPWFGHFLLFLLYLCYYQSEIIQIFTKKPFRAIRPCNIE